MQIRAQNANYKAFLKSIPKAFKCILRNVMKQKIKKLSRL